MQKQRFKELEESYSLMREDTEGKTKERIAGRQRKLRDVKEALCKVIISINGDAEVIITQ